MVLNTNDSDTPKFLLRNIRVCLLLTVRVVFVFKNTVDAATENFAEIVDRYRGNRLVVLKTVDEASADSVGVDKLVGSYSFFFHSFV